MIKKTNGLMTKLAMLAGVVVMGGCTTMTDIQRTEAKIKAKDGIVFAQVVGTKSVVSVCEAFASANDDRCKKMDAYNAYYFNATNETVRPGTYVDNVIALVPKTAGELPFRSIAKLRIDGFRPAYFEMFAAYADKDESCRWIVNFPGTSGVSCPKYNWDYRKDLNL